MTSETLMRLVAWMGLALGLVGVGVAFWALWGDRSRGRRRCAGCWYDMQGVPGLRCPECGREARNERGLLWTRRRWGALIAGVLVAGGGLAGGLGPQVRREGWGSLAPELLLVRALPRAGAEAGPLDWASAEMARRRTAGTLSREAVTAALLRQEVLRTPVEWPEGMVVAAEYLEPRWTRRLPRTPLQVRARAVGAGSTGWRGTDEVWSGEDRFAPAYIPMLEATSDLGGVRFELEVSDAALGVWTIPVPLAVRRVPATPMVADHSEETSRAVAAAIRWDTERTPSVWQGEWILRTSPKCLRERLAGFEDMDIAIRLDIDQGLGWEEFGSMMKRTLGRFENESVLGDSVVLPSESFWPPNRLSRPPEGSIRPREQWRIRLAGIEPPWPRWPVRRWWAGEAIVPYATALEGIKEPSPDAIRSIR